MARQWAPVLGTVFAGRSFSDIERDLSTARRNAALGDEPLDEQLAVFVSRGKLTKSTRIDVAASLVEQGLLSQRKAHSLTGVSRDTIRAHAGRSTQSRSQRKKARPWTKENFLLGKGERLVEDIIGVRGGAPKQHPYTFTEAQSRLRPMLDEVVLGIDQLPETACPDDQAVAMVTLNPEYIAKSYFPNKLFKILDLELVGSRPLRLTPEKRSKGRQPEQVITTQLFVRGTRPSFREWRSRLPHWHEDIPGVTDLVTIEQVSAPTSRDKIKGELPKSGDTVLAHSIRHEARM